VWPRLRVADEMAWVWVKAVVLEALMFETVSLPSDSAPEPNARSTASMEVRTTGKTV
jgi:hypothetical protein